MQITRSLKHFFLPVQPTAKALKTILYGMFAIMAFVFIAYFLIGIIAILRNSSLTASAHFVSLPYAAMVAALKTWLFALTVAYVFYVLISKNPKCNLIVILCLAFILKSVWFFSHQVIDFIQTKTAVYKINLLQNDKEIKNAFSSYQQYPEQEQKFILEAIALNPFTSEQTLAEIANLDEKTLHEKTGSIFFFQPSNSSNFAVMHLIARHPQVLPSTLEKLANSPSMLVVGEVAENPKTPQATLNMLWEKYGEKIAYNISLNSKVSPQILVFLAHEKYPENDPAGATALEQIKANVARNPNTPGVILEELSRENSWLILQSLIDNPKISLSLLQKMTTHPNEYARDYAKEKIKRLQL
ncbi:MAG: hypothetical protein HYX61_11965 [Gammaproteobacteria bacterium]|jgi:hypothetical protein|nr:hypothetical protein [Gammaproteobacteria bacterium]